MAKAEKIAPTPPTPTYRLELTEEEAQLVHALVGRVVGGDYGASAIYGALYQAGIIKRFDTENRENIRVVVRV